MRKYLHNVAMMIMAVATIGTFSSCDKDEPVVLPEPEVSSVEYLADKTTETSVAVKVNFVEADAINYTCYLSSESKGDWKTKSVAVDAKSVEITFEGLESGSAYKAEFYASNGEIKSATKSLTFTTNEPLPVPTVVSAEYDEANISESEVKFVVACNEATSIKYAYYATADAETVEKNWASVEIEEGAESVEVLISELEAETAYTAEFVAVNGEIESEATAVEFTTAAALPVPSIVALTVVEGSVTDTAASITVEYAEVTAIKFAHYVAADAETVEKEWNTLPIPAAGGASIDMPFMALTAETEYTAEFIAVNGEIESEAKTINFTTTAPAAPAEPVSFEITEITPFTALLSVTVNGTDCQGWAYMQGETAYGVYTDYMQSSIEGGYCTIFEGNSTFVLGSDYALKPSTGYTIAVAGVSDIEEVESYYGTAKCGKMYGEILFKDFTTEAPKLGAADEDVTIEFTSASHVAAKISITRGSENVKSYYNGCAKKSEVTGGDVEAWINSTGWFANAYSNAFTYYEGGTSKEVDTVEASYANLSEATDYYAFVIPITEDGALGNLATMEFSTAALSYDENIIGDVVVSPKTLDADVTVTFGAETTKVYYLNYAVGWYDEDQLKSMVLDQMTNDYTYWAATDAVDGVLEVNLPYLQLGTEYSLTTLPVTADGKLGVVKTQYYSTKSATFDSEATVEITLTEAIKDSYGWMNVSFDVAMGNGAVKYTFGYVEDEIVINKVPQAYGAALLKGSPQTSDAAEISFAYPNVGYIFIAIPVDADGNYGTPVTYKFTQDEWDSYVYVEPAE